MLFLLVDPIQAKKYLGKNRTLMFGESGIDTIDHYINLNWVCKEMGIGIFYSLFYFYMIIKYKLN